MSRDALRFASLDPAAIAAFTAGILAICALRELPAAALLGVAALPALLPWRGRALWAMAMLGALLATLHGRDYLAGRWPAARQNQEIVAVGRIASLPESSREEGDARTWRFLFTPEGSDLPRRIRVAWYRSAEPIRGGDCWQLSLRMRTPHGSLNPAGFDYEGWLFRQGIAATATVRAGQRCAAAGGGWLLQRRQALSDRLAQWLPQPRGRALVAALTTGDQSGLSDRDWDVFRVTGTSHLVAISGFNIAIFAGFVFFLIRWLWSASARLCQWLPAQRAAMAGSALAAGAYAALAGLQPPVARAGLMLGVLLVAAWSHRPAAASRVLALAWLAILVGEPFAVLAPGLWLSFGAVAAIIYVSAGRLRPPGALRAMIRLQLVLSAAMVPLTLYFFQGAAWLGPLVNLVAVPVVTVMTPLLLIALALAALVPAAGVPALQYCAAALIKCRAGLEWAATALPGVWIPASPPTAALLLAAIGIVLLIAPRGLPLRLPGALCLIPLLLPRAPAPASALQVTVLDVGQGLAAVVQTRAHALLFDAGPAFADGFDAGQSVVAPFLLHAGIRRLDLLVLSHTDNDHAGGVPAVRRLLRVDRELGTDRGEPCRDGIRWEWDGVRFEVLHPGGGEWSINNSSCVLKVDGGFAALLPGDIEAGAEQRLVADHAAQLKSDLLVAPHHGSRTSSTEAFVGAIAPAAVIYGAGWRNHFGHPRPEVVARYARIGARQFSTGGSGAVAVSGSQGGLQIGQWRAAADHFWNAPPEAVPLDGP